MSGTNDDKQKIKEIKHEVNPEVVKLLSTVMGLAKQGDCKAIAIVGVYDDNYTFNCYACNFLEEKIIAALRILERDIIDTHGLSRIRLT